MKSIILALGIAIIALSQSAFGQELFPRSLRPMQPSMFERDYGLVAEWLFEEGTGNKVYDYGSFAIDGTLTSMNESSDWIVDPTGTKKGSVLDFDGVNDYVDFGNNSALNFTTSDFTYVAVLYIISWGNYDVFINRGQSLVDGYYIQVGTVSELNFVFCTGVANGTITSTSGAIAPNNWYHLVFIRSGSTGYIYVNGLDKTSSAAPINPTSTTKPLLLGSYVGGELWPQFRAKYMAVYNRALTSDEVKRSYEESLAYLNPESGNLLVDHLIAKLLEPVGSSATGRRRVIIMR